MKKQRPIRVLDSNDNARLALVRELRDQGRVVVAKRGDEQGKSGTGRIFIELPSDLTLLEPIADYIMTRVNQLWSVPDDRSIGLALAVREALINAIAHGNHSVHDKVVFVTVDVSADKASFTVEDQGAGFDVNDVPHPLNPENLLKSSGRGVLLIRTIMDEVHYNDRGNRVTMIKSRGSLLGADSMKRGKSK